MDQLLHAAGIPQRVPIFDDAQSRDELVDRLGRELLVVCSGIMLTLPRKRRGSAVWRVIRCVNPKAYERHHRSMFRLFGESMMAVDSGLRRMLVSEIDSPVEVDQLLLAAFGICTAMFASMLRLTPRDKELLLATITEVSDDYRANPPRNDEERSRRFLCAVELQSNPIHIGHLIQRLLHCEFRLQPSWFAKRWIELGNP
jgi:hypothetical protein